MIQKCKQDIGLNPIWWYMTNDCPIVDALVANEERQSFP